jgi:hypothetical protein
VTVFDGNGELAASLPAGLYQPVALLMPLNSFRLGFLFLRPS